MVGPGARAFWDVPDEPLGARRGERAGPAGAPRGRRARWRRSVWRRVVAAVLAVGAVLATAAATRPPSPVPGVPVVVASRDLAAGAVIGPDDLRSVPWPVDVAPDGSVAEGDLVGQALAGPVAAGEPLTRHRVVGAGLLDGQPEGTAAAYVPLQGDGVAAMVRAGDRVDVVASDGAVLASAVVVLAVTGTGRSGADEGLQGLAANAEPGVVVAVPQVRVPALAAAVDATTGQAPSVVLSARDPAHRSQ